MVELIEMGWNRLAIPDSDGLAEKKLSAVGKKGKDVKPYDSGNSVKLIVEHLIEVKNGQH